MKKRGFFLWVCMFWFICSGNVKAETEIYNGFHYDVLDDGTLIITNYFGEDDVLQVPDEINGKKVTEIRFMAFSGDSYEKIILGQNITKVGERALNCNYIGTLVLPDTKEELNINWTASNIDTIVIPEKRENLPETLFSNGCVKQFEVDEDNSFYSSDEGILFNKDKTELIRYPTGKTDEQYCMPDSVQVIRKKAFKNCKVLKEMKLSSSLNQIGEDAFLNCSEMTEICLPDQIEELSSNTFYGSGIKRVVLGKGLKRIENMAFNSQLDEVVLSGNLENWDFSKNDTIGKLTITDTVTLSPEELEALKIPVQNEYSCSESNEIFSYDNGVLYTADRKSLVAYPCKKEKTTFVIPDGVEIICPNAFHCNESLVEIVCPESLRKIGESAFARLSQLERVNLNHASLSLGTRAFMYCRNLKQIEESDRIISIGTEAFYDCSLLSGFVIPDTCQIIDQMAFFKCKSITEFTIPDSVTKIGGGAFFDMTGLENITLGKGLEKIECGLFYGNSSLKWVMIPNEIKKLSYILDFDKSCQTWDPKSIVIRGYEYSEADIYAKENKLQFEKIPWDLPKKPTGFTLTELSDFEKIFSWNPAENKDHMQRFLLYKNGIKIESLGIEENRKSIWETRSKNGDVYELSLVNRDGIESEKAMIKVPGIMNVNFRIECEPNTEGEAYVQGTDHGAYPGQEVTVQALCSNPVSGYFSGWYDTKGKLLSMEPTYTFIMPDQEPILIAKFKEREKYTLSLTSSWNNVPLNGAGQYYAGETVHFSIGWFESPHFQGWYDEKGQLISQHPIETINLNRDMSLFAKFEVIPEKVEEKPNEDPGVTEEPKKDQKEKVLFRKNMVFEDKNYQYRILSIDNNKKMGTISCDGFVKKKKKVDVSGTVKYKGYSWKVVKVSDCAFAKQLNITSVKLHSNITVIGKSAFEGCQSIKSINLGYGVKIIGDNAFKKCSNLTNISLGKNVISIGKQTFCYCKNLRKINIQSSKLKKVGKNAFYRIHSNATIKVPKKKIKEYKKLLKNKGQNKKVVIR